MRFTEELANRIWQAFESHAGSNVHCSLCGKDQFTISDGFAVVDLFDDTPIKYERKARHGIPCASFTCTTCGNTYLINLLALGLKDILELDESPPRGGQANG